MKRTAMIHIDAIRREYPAAWLLGEALKLRGYTVIYTSRISTHYLLKLVRPDIIVLSHCFSVPVDTIKRLKDKGTLLFITEVEGVFDVDHDIGTTYPQNVDLNLFSGVFVWNKWSKEWLLKNRSVNSNVIHNSGSIRNSLLSNFNRKTESKLRVGILGRFECINVFDNRHAFENLAIAPRHHYDRWHADLDAFYTCREIIKGLLDKGFEVSIRPHPNENVKAYSILRENLGNSLSADMSFDYTQWLESIDVLVGTVSSAFMEPYFLGVPIICIDNITGDSGPEHLSEWREIFRSSAYMPGSIAEALDLLAKGSLEPKKSNTMDNYIDNMYDLKLDGLNAIESVSDQIAKSDFDYKKNLLIPAWFSYTIKKLLDLAVILASISIKRKGAWSLGNQRQYNYNDFLHKPSRFMVKCKTKLIKNFKDRSV